MSSQRKRKFVEPQPFTVILRGGFRCILNEEETYKLSDESVFFRQLMFATQTMAAVNENGEPAAITLEVSYFLDKIFSYYLFKKFLILIFIISFYRM